MLSLDETQPDDPRERVSQALTDLLHNPQTPAGLFEAIASFVADGVNNELLHSAPFLGSLIARLDDPIGARQGGRQL